MGVTEITQGADGQFRGAGSAGGSQNLPSGVEPPVSTPDSKRSGDSPAPTMYAEERRQAIVRMASARGRVAVTDLAATFAVAPETIRRDLDVLVRSGLVDRVHGGAIPRSSFGTAESTARERRTTRGEAKAAIARAAMAYLPEAHGSIILDGGTTTGALAAEITLRAEQDPSTGPLTVITDSVRTGLELSTTHNLSVHLLGGVIREVTETVVGATALTMLGRVAADVAFLGTNGLSAAYGLTTPDVEEAAVKRLMATRSQRCVLLADSSKFDSDFLCTFAELDQLDVLITDAEPPTRLAQALAQNEIEVVIA